MIIPLINPQETKQPPKSVKDIHATIKELQETIEESKRITEGFKRQKRNPSRAAKRTIRHLARDISHYRHEIEEHSRLIKALKKNPKKKSPATSGRELSNLKKEGIMPIYARKRSRRSSGRRRAARRNPLKSGYRPVVGWHRPRLIYTRQGKWRRARRNRLFPQGRIVRINPRRRYRRRRNPEMTAPVANPRRYRRRRSYRHNPRYRRSFSRRRYRRNPAIPFQIDKVVVGSLRLVGGLAIYFLGMPMLVGILPANIVKFRKFFGAAYLLVGAFAAATMKKKTIRDVALVVAGTGVYDLIAMNLAFLGLPAPAGGTSLRSDYEPYIGASYQPSLGASYQDVMVPETTSVGVDDIAYGGDSIELD